MGLLSGSVSITRFNVTAFPGEIDFEKAAFREIAAGSEVRESRGFVPMVPGGEYKIGTRRWAFRMRIDTLKPDPTRARERLQELIRTELDSGAESVGPKKRRQLRNLAQEELLAEAAPSSKIIEGCIDGDVLYVATTAKNALGPVTEELRKIGVHVEPKAPWIDRDEPEYESDVVAASEPGESALGCRLLRELVGDTELTIEPAEGWVRLRTRDTGVTLTGMVFHELLHYLEQDAELLGAKMVSGDVSFRLDALSFRISSLHVETAVHEHWTGTLDERLEKVAAVFELLDVKFFELGHGLE